MTPEQLKAFRRDALSGVKYAEMAQRYCLHRSEAQCIAQHVFGVQRPAGTHTTARNRALAAEYAKGGQTVAEIAAGFGITRQRAYQIIRAAKRQHATPARKVR